MMAQALQSRLESIDASDPRLYQGDAWRPLFCRVAKYSQQLYSNFIRGIRPLPVRIMN